MIGNMLGYSEANKIYFSVGDRTGFAAIKAAFSQLDQLEFAEKDYNSLVNSGSFQGMPEFKYLNFLKGLDYKTKQCHAAEHKTYNAFKKKTRKLKANTKLENFAQLIPSLAEIKNASSFSIFCGTSFIFSSSISMILMSLPNLFRYKNTELLFMSSWFVFSIAVLFISSFLIQKMYLAKPNNLQLFIAQKALKEVLNGNNSKPSAKSWHDSKLSSSHASSGNNANLGIQINRGKIHQQT